MEQQQSWLKPNIIEILSDIGVESRVGCCWPRLDGHSEWQRIIESTPSGSGSHRVTQRWTWKYYTYMNIKPDLPRPCLVLWEYVTQICREATWFQEKVLFGFFFLFRVLLFWFFFQLVGWLVGGLFIWGCFVVALFLVVW